MISSGEKYTYFLLLVFHWLLQDNSGKQNFAMYNVTKERETNKLWVNSHLALCQIPNISQTETEVKNVFF